MPETAAVVVPHEEVMTEPASAVRITEDGERSTYNTDHSLLDVAAGPQDVFISSEIWRGWELAFDNHVVMNIDNNGNAIHRFYNTPEGMTDEQARRPGVISPFGQPSIEVMGRVHLPADTRDPTSVPMIVNPNSSGTVRLQNILRDDREGVVETTGVTYTMSSGTRTGHGPPLMELRTLQSLVAGHDAVGTAEAISGAFASEVQFRTSIVTNNTTQWIRWSGPSTPMQWDDYRQHIRKGRYTRRHRRFRDYARQRRENERNTAEMRAEQLLWHVLDRRQKRDWKQLGYFEIEVGPRRYRIERGSRVGNVSLIDQHGEVIKRFCCHTDDHVPMADNALAQMMTLIHDEAGFLELANVHYDRDQPRSGNLINWDDDGTVMTVMAAA